MSLVLHGYWRSSAAYRVRIALALKGLEYQPVSHDLRGGAQHAPAYRALAPQALVPALEADGQVLTQSLAILEWLEETHPAPALLPAGAGERAIVRAMALCVACDIHPLNNLRVLQVLKHDLGLDEAARDRWVARWIGEGFAALETMVARHGGQYCFGDEPGLADCCLVPQIYNARRFGVDLEPYPRLVAIDGACQALAAFAAAAPENQPDAPGPDA
ncbi:maleylacetoacetate isomerase [Novosphingobium colocasiae]|uniref:Maleylacetoacetate isomerase n=1 Tax=Novosphingobium colocasiae TaxID=1256513 RepID=A0A918P951_9SPHN|nr:maleylacetoacetate isomerase [Novosphingobium colocasiae]GGY91717.1 maleylacetoacetate isomerase [Novosphingobium colocasiae]